jgi:hypothetical protein
MLHSPARPPFKSWVLGLSSGEHFGLSRFTSVKFEVFIMSLNGAFKILVPTLEPKIVATQLISLHTANFGDNIFMCI